MTESRSASDGKPAPAGSPVTTGLAVGWSVTGLGALIIAATLAVSLYLMASADSGIQLAGWFFTMLFFGAFPAMAGLGLIIWGGRIVRRTRSKQRHG